MPLSHGQSKAIPAPSRNTTRHHPAPSLFHARLQPQPLNPPIEVSLDPKTYLLFTALLQELRMRNQIELKKLDMDMRQQEKEKEAAKQAKEAEELARKEDDERFSEIRGSLYM